MKNDIEIKELLNKFEDVKIHSITEISETADEATIYNTQKIKEKFHDQKIRLRPINVFGFISSVCPGI